MSEKPILFSAPMVHALLAGRKTQTRRVVKGHVHDLTLDPLREDAMHHGWAWFQANGADMPGNHSVPCPYGQPGDLLWVRETWAEHHPCGVPEDRYSIEGRAGIPGPPGVRYRVIYRADGEPIRVWHCPGYPYRTTAGPADDIAAKHPEVCSEFPGWRPSIHMPRWASRVTLRLTGVRVERVQEISDADAESEGIEGRNMATGGDDFQDLWRDYSKPDRPEKFPWFEGDQHASFRSLWDSLNAGRGFGWDANPWVWVVEFEVIHRNVDEVLGGDT